MSSKVRLVVFGFLMCAGLLAASGRITAHSLTGNDTPSINNDSSSGGCLKVTVLDAQQNFAITAPFSLYLSHKFPLTAGQKYVVTVTNSDPTQAVGNDLFSYTPPAWVQFFHTGIGSQSTGSIAPVSSLSDSIVGGTSSGAPGTVYFTVTHIDNCSHYFADDGRVNPYDAQQSNTAYCRTSGNLDVWGVYLSKGYYLFTITKKQIKDGVALAASSHKNVLLGQKKGTQLWALMSNQLQLRDSSGGQGAYYFVFAATICG